MIFTVDSPPMSSVMKDKFVALELNPWAFKFLNFSWIRFSVDALVYLYYWAVNYKMGCSLQVICFNHLKPKCRPLYLTL